MNFNQQGAALTGTLVSPFGTSQIRDGKVTADGFSFAANYFDATTDVVPLHVPAFGGVYAAMGSFPTSVYANANYWVDVVVAP